jgi:hypothetical protein
MTDPQRARNILDFVLDLSQSPEKAASYKADPSAYMTSQQQEILQAQESALADRTDRGEVGATGEDGGGGTTVILAVVVVVVA